LITGGDTIMVFDHDYADILTDSADFTTADTYTADILIHASDMLKINSTVAELRKDLFLES